jgi:hypothetical protein
MSCPSGHSGGIAGFLPYSASSFDSAQDEVVRAARKTHLWVSGLFCCVRS